MTSTVSRVALLLYLLLIGGFVGWAAIATRDPPAATADADKAVTAKRNLPANHLLRAGDLDGTDTAGLVGHYLTIPVARNAAVAEANVGPVPVLDDGDDVLVAVPLPTALAIAGRGNADDPVILCKGEAKVADTLVLAQLCSGDGDSTVCRALVASPPAPPISPAGLRATISTCALTPVDGPDSAK